MRVSEFNMCTLASKGVFTSVRKRVKEFLHVYVGEVRSLHIGRMRVMGPLHAYVSELRSLYRCT